MATVATAAPTAKQTSRKGKKAWRKNVDITEVTSGLEQVRSEIIQGGVIAEKSDSSLFQIDTTGSTTIAKSHHRTSKPLKVDEILAARSAVPALINPKKRSIIGDGILPEKKRRKNGVAFKDLERLRRIAYGGEEATDNVKRTSDINELYDPWEDVVPDTTSMVEKGIDRLSFIEKPKKAAPPVTLKHAPIGLSEGGVVPAVKLPDPGISYNPEFEKWDDLITREGEKEIAQEIKRLKQAEYEKKILEVAAQEDDEEDSSEGDESSEDEKEGEVNTLKKVPRRKTPAERNKVNRRKEEERLRRHLANIEVQKHQLDTVKKLRQSIDLKLKANQLAKRKALTPAKRLARRRKFDRDLIPQAPLELQLPDELADSLRKLKPEGNLLRDRFRSLRERGVVETRLMQKQKKARRKATEKWSYKDWKF